MTTKPVLVDSNVRTEVETKFKKIVELIGLAYGENALNAILGEDDSIAKKVSQDSLRYLGEANIIAESISQPTIGANKVINSFKKIIQSYKEAIINSIEWGEVGRSDIKNVNFYPRYFKCRDRNRELDEQSQKALLEASNTMMAVYGFGLVDSE